MNKFRFIINVLAIAIFAFAFVSTAQAQASRTWVSGVGDDVNPCSRTAPCKTFAGAISRTATNGEINCLDPGGFGALKRRARCPICQVPQCREASPKHVTAASAKPRPTPGTLAVGVPAVSNLLLKTCEPKRECPWKCRC